MEAKLEFLERSCESFVATKEKIQEMRNLIETKKYQSHHWIDKLFETVCGLTLRNDNLGYGTSVFWQNL